MKHLAKTIKFIIRAFKRYHHSPIILRLLPIFLIVLAIGLKQFTTIPLVDEYEYIFTLMGFALAVSPSLSLARSRRHVIKLVLFSYGIFITNHRYFTPDSSPPTTSPAPVTETTISMGIFFIFFVFVSIYAITFAYIYATVLIIKLVKYIFKHPVRVLQGSGWLVMIATFVMVWAGLIVGYRQLTTTNSRLDRLETAFGGDQALNCPKEQMVEKVAPSIVRVVGGYSEGTGVIVKTNGLIVTNHHVVEFEPSPKIIFPDYTFETATIIMADRDADIALLRVDRATPHFLSPIATLPQTLKPLDKVYSFGYPLGTDLAGGPTIQEGRFVSLRQAYGIEYLHTDLSLQEGSSGGALTDVCGNLLGINQATMTEASFTIANSTLLNTWFANLLEAKTPKMDVEPIDFKPTESALEAVRAFYNYQKVRQLEEAYALLADSFLQGKDFDEWKQGYQNVISVDLIAGRELEDEPNTIYVKFTSKDLENEQAVYRYFEGTWYVEEVDGRYLLATPDIKEIFSPSWDWFWDFQSS